MGENQLGELHKPARNKWAEQGMAEGRFGPTEGAGLESVAAGGLYSLFVDENGTVCDIFYLFDCDDLIPLLGLVVRDKRRCCSRKSHIRSSQSRQAWRVLGCRCSNCNPLPYPSLNR
jgi:hypothetical protein